MTKLSPRKCVFIKYIIIYIHQNKVSNHRNDDNNDVFLYNVSSILHELCYNVGYNI